MVGEGAPIARTAAKTPQPESGTCATSSAIRFVVMGPTILPLETLAPVWKGASRHRFGSRRHERVSC